MFELSIEKADVCAKAMKDYFSNTISDATVEVPVEIVDNKQEYLNYIFYSCLLDYGMKSKLYHQNLKNTYKLHKEIFCSKYVIENYKNNQEKLLKIIRENIHPRYPNVAVKKWLELSEYLNTTYPDDELYNKIASLNTYQELSSFLIKINGYGQKTGGLLIRLIYEANICNITDNLENIPIDCHDIEISYLNGVINKKDLNKTNINKLGKLWVEVAVANNINPSDIDKYLWSIGNTLCNKKRCDSCPLNFNCISKNKIN